MTLIRSISGIRGTIGGLAGEGLTPSDIVKYTAAYGFWVKRQKAQKRPSVVTGRDARISGQMVENIVNATLQGMGIDVINLGLASTPTVEIGVTECRADGGIIITASHNPAQWNALKLLNRKGEFLSAADGADILQIAENEGYIFAGADNLGNISYRSDMDDIHIKKILGLKLVDPESIAAAGFTVALDCVNSVGGIILPKLLKALGVKQILELYCTPDGCFPHNPEPLPGNLRAIAALIKDKGADLGFVTDPDVDRLAIVCEDGSMFGEEYTLVAVADYVLQHTPGNTVSNLSSTKALRELTHLHKGEYSAAAVGEVNVVEKMKATKAVIGGEGNGGVIYPALHHGRDALAGIALFLSFLAKSGLRCSTLRKRYPDYHISKNKIELGPTINVDKVLEAMEKKYARYPVDTVDGVKIELEEGWVHLRKSNTEPIIRIYSESNTKEEADKLAFQIIDQIKNLR